MPGRVWSKLEIQLRELADPVLDLRFRFTTYRQKAVETARTFDPAQKFWITQGKSTIWAVPRDRHSGDKQGVHFTARRSPSWLVEIAAQYLALPRTALMDWQPEWAGWGLVDILKACDRRIGSRRWPALREIITEPAAFRLLDLRAGVPVPERFPVAGRDVDQTHDPD